ncbi:MAG: hypothetical protein NC548_26105 [Lachnospiraceae bacterium]|nr:hypothetical protein [Lachnospiraceae bacterium]
MENKKEIYQKILEQCDNIYGFNKHTGIPYVVINMVCDSLNINRNDISFKEITEMFDVEIG